MRVLALATCHNRRTLTLRALECLHRQSLPGGTTLQVCLVDDGSTDGTGEAVRLRFPSVVLLHASGNLFWAGGMRYGWAQYVRAQDPDYLLVFNDDIDLRDDALNRLLSVATSLEMEGCTAFAVAGAFCDPESGHVAYGGVVRSSWWHPLRFAKVRPNDTIQECHTLNMNFSLLSRGALRSVGFLAGDFVHSKADYDFGLRLRAAGGRVVLAPGYMGNCRRNEMEGTSVEGNLEIAERWRRLTSVKEQPPRERAIYYRRHAGILWPVFWVLPYARVALESVVQFIGRWGRVRSSKSEGP